jgi:hypothetical protein
MGVGIGGGIGPVRVSAHVSGRSSANGCAIFFGVVLGILFLFWPYALSTYVAVKVFDVAKDSTACNVIGWIFEAPWLLLLLLTYICYVIGKSQDD